MKSGLFWKLLLSFWLTFFAITQGIWLMVNVLNITPVSERTLGERVAPLLLAQLADSLARGGPGAATAMLATFPPDDQRRIEILPLPGTARPPHNGDASVTRTTRAPDGRDYQVDDVLWMWHHTSQEDKKIIELNQAGVNSAFFEPGPYTPMEADCARYVDWYVEAMRATISG